MPARADGTARTPLLARLRVGTKLMLLVLLPVCVLLGFTSLTTLADWKAANELQHYRAGTRLSAATAGLADRLAVERTAAVLLRLQPTEQPRTGLAAAQRAVDQELQQARQRAMGWHGEVDVAGRLGAARRQLAAVRLQVSAGALSVQQITGAYGPIVNDLINSVGELIAGRPTQASGRAADTYLAIFQAVEAAQRERVDVAALLSDPTQAQLVAAGQWPAVEGAELDAFRRNAAGGLSADLEGVLFSPAGMKVQQVRNALRSNMHNAITGVSLRTWMDASGARISGLRQLERGAAGDLAETASADLSAARAGGIRDLSLSLAVLVVVAALALALRRSITRPLQEVSEGARTLSSGDLAFDVRYAGRDEIGDVAVAFRDLHVTAERLAGEIRATNAAISANRLDHRADVSAFDGTWAQLLAGLNDTTAAFATLHGRRRQAERELEGIFNLSLDLLCITGTDGYFKRVNPAFEQTLGYTSGELLARPFIDFVHPADRAATLATQASLAAGQEVAQFENRYIRSDGTECWLQWSARAVPDEGLIYGAARDVTETRRASEQQAALRRVAMLVAQGVPPGEVFDAVVAEMRLLLGAENTRLMRYEEDGIAAVVATSHEPGLEIPVGTRQRAEDGGVVGEVYRTGRPARLDSIEGLSGPIAELLRRLGVRSAAGAPVIVEGRLWGVMVAAWRRYRPVSGTEDRIAQFTELVATAISNAQARTDLAASRARIVAASDETRRRIERDLHDGTQQRLVTLGLELRTAQQAVRPDQADLEAELARVADGIADVLEELREISRGIHPAILSEGGLRPALKALARRSAVPVKLELGVSGRLPTRVEVAAYFVVSEALANAAKHAQAAVVHVSAQVRSGTLEIRVRDDGRGGADPSQGTGLVGLTDRVEALGGIIDVSSPAGRGTRITVALPADGSAQLPRLACSGAGQLHAVRAVCAVCAVRAADGAGPDGGGGSTPAR
jgi:PAS domain S-box-containing protein